MKKSKDKAPFLACLTIFLLVSAHLAIKIYQNPAGTAQIRLKNGKTNTASVPPSLAKNIKVNGQYPAYQMQPSGAYMLGTDNGVSQLMQVQVTGLKMAW